MKNYKNIILGLILILIGIVIGTNSLGITNINIFFFKKSYCMKVFMDNH